MKKIKHIHSYDSLQAELSRLEREAKMIEEKLDNNFEHLQENFSSMAMNSFFHRKANWQDARENGSFFKNEKLNTMVNKFTDRVVERAAEGLEKITEKLFQKKKHGAD